MIEAMQGDGLTKHEMKQRGIILIDGTRGGIELHAPTYANTIAQILMERSIIALKHLNAACDYLELKNSVYGSLNAKTMAGILRTGDCGTCREHAEDAYYIAARYIGRNNEAIVIRAMNDNADETLDMAMVVNAYRTAFHSVFDGMDLAISKIKEMIEKGLA